jgi:hypothetical protein
MHCRVLLTNNLEIFSVGSTVVLSRGLIDVVPDEAAMAAMLAHGLADAMLPKPYQDQYGFSDIMRFTATEVLKHLTFEDEKSETTEISRKALELLKKSPYAAKLDSVGLFLTQLRSVSKQLKHLISPQLGNEVYFESQLMHSAPALQPVNMAQLAALPMGSRLKIDPWTAEVSLRKSRPVSLMSPPRQNAFSSNPHGSLLDVLRGNFLVSTKFGLVQRLELVDTPPFYLLDNPGTDVHLDWLCSLFHLGP